MKTPLLITLIAVFIISISTDIFAQRRLDWAFGAGVSTNNDRGYNIAEDASGNIYVTGEFEGTVNFDPNGTNNKTSVGSTDVFIAKYSSTNALQWVVSAGGTSEDRGYGIDVDGSGNVYVTGYFENSIDFGGSSLTSAGDKDVFIVKYNTSGVHQWSQNYGDTGEDEGLDIVSDGSGNVYITGYFNTAIDFGGSALTSAGSTDIFLAKYNTSGVHQWSQNYGTSFAAEGRRITLDKNNNVYITGFIAGNGFNTTMTFGGDTFTPFAVSAFVAKFNSSGTHLLSFKTANGSPTNNCIGGDLTVDASEEIYVTGTFKGTVDFDPSSGGTVPLSATIQEIFVAKYTAAGAYDWAFDVGGTAGQNAGAGITLDGFNNVWVTGLFQGISIDFDPSGTTNALSAVGNYDIFVAKYDDAGLYQEAFSIGSSTEDAGSDIHVGIGGDIYTTGWFGGSTIDFEPASNISTLSSNGFEDIFLAKYYAVEILPVELTTFIGEAQAIGNLLSWETASEEQNKGFEIQRAQQQNEWTTIGFVDGNGTTLEAQEYTFLDNKAPKGVNYYRLKQVDLDGRYDYSKVITLESNRSTDKFIVYPTLATDHINIEVEKTTLVQIFNGYGQLLTTQQIDAQTQMDISTFPQGTYFVKTDKAVTRFVIMR